MIGDFCNKLVADFSFFKLLVLHLFTTVENWIVLRHDSSWCLLKYVPVLRVIVLRAWNCVGPDLLSFF